jgi:hypothetical protein
VKSAGAGGRLSGAAMECSKWIGYHDVSPTRLTGSTRQPGTREGSENCQMAGWLGMTAWINSQAKTSESGYNKGLSWNNILNLNHYLTVLNSQHWWRAESF